MTIAIVSLITKRALLLPDQFRLPFPIQLNALLDDVAGIEAAHEAFDFDLFVFRQF